MKLMLFWPVFGFSLLLLAGCPSSTKEENRGVRQMFSIKDAMNTSDAQAKLNSNVPLYFGGQSVPGLQQKLGEYTTIKRTNSFNKSAVDACNWAFLSAMISLQERALREGGNAVINISSYYKKNLVNSASQYECEPGNLMAGVSFKGTVAKVAK